MQANFVRGRGDMMGTSGSLNDRATITAPVNSYYPNDFGLYNMAGNVNEWVLDVYRPTSYEVVAEYNSFRGNVYLTPRATGKISLVAMFIRLIHLAVLPTTASTSVILKMVILSRRLISALRMPICWPATQWNYRHSSSVISKNTRVYKGGSWKDRVYWLNPSTRRYLDQNKAANDIGFRCAMSMIGNIEQKK